MPEKLLPWKLSGYLKTAEDVANFLNASMTDGGDSAASISLALGAIVEARGHALRITPAPMPERPQMTR